MTQRRPRSLSSRRLAVHLRRLPTCTALCLLPALADAQPLALDGQRIRVRLAGPDGPWAYGAVLESAPDSLSMQLADRHTAIRFRRDLITLERFAGYQSASGAARGAVIGGLAMLGLMLTTPEFQGDGLESLLGLVLVPAGAAVGAMVGVAAAPERWSPVSRGQTDCGGWRPLDASLAGRDLVVRSGRNRRRGAVIGAVVLGGIGLVGGLTDPTFPASEVPGVVLSNALIGALVGAWRGPRERVAIPASCP